MKNSCSRGSVTMSASFLIPAMPHCWNQLQLVANLQGSFFVIQPSLLFSSYFIFKFHLISAVLTCCSLLYRQTLHGAPGGISGNLQQVQSRNQLQVSSACVSSYCYIYEKCYNLCFSFWFLHVFVLKQDIKSEMNPMMNPRAAGPEGSLIGVHGICCKLLSTFCWKIYLFFSILVFISIWDFTSNDSWGLSLVVKWLGGGILGSSSSVDKMFTYQRNLHLTIEHWNRSFPLIEFSLSMGLEFI